MAGSWHLCVALVVHLALTALLLVSFGLNHYHVDSCEVGICSVTYTIPQADMQASSSFGAFKQGMCSGLALECPHLCDILGRMELAGTIYLILGSLAVMLLLASVLHLSYLNCVRPIAVRSAYLLHVGATTLNVILGVLSCVISGSISDPEVSIAQGEQLLYAAIGLSVFAGLHYVYLRKRGFLGLNKLKYTELEGTHMGS